MKALIHDTFPQLESDDVRSCSMGSGGEDLQLSPAARRLLPFNIECKHRARIAVFADYAQAESHGTHEPVVFLRQNRSKALALVDAQYFLMLVAK